MPCRIPVRAGWKRCPAAVSSSFDDEVAARDCVHELVDAFIAGSFFARCSRV